MVISFIKQDVQPNIVIKMKMRNIVSNNNVSGGNIDEINNGIITHSMENIMSI